MMVDGIRIETKKYIVFLYGTLCDQSIHYTRHAYIFYDTDCAVVKVDFEFFAWLSLST